MYSEHVQMSHYGPAAQFCGFAPLEKGMHNQIEAIFIAVLVAIHLECTLILPSFLSNFPPRSRLPIKCAVNGGLMDQNATCYNNLGFEELFDTQYFISHMSRHVSILSRPQAQQSGLARARRHEQWHTVLEVVSNETRSLFWQRHGRLVATSPGPQLKVVHFPAIASLPPSNWVNDASSRSRRAAVRDLRAQFHAAFRPSAALRRVMQSYMALLPTRCVTPGAAGGCLALDYDALHWRVGSDMERWVTGPLRRAPLLHAVRKHLGRRTDGSVLWLAGDIDQTILNFTRQLGYTVLWNEAVKLRPQHREVLACIERFILQSSRLFIGMWRSTLSFTVYESRQATRLPFADYFLESRQGTVSSRQCRADRICAKQQEWITLGTYHAPPWTFALAPGNTLQKTCFTALQGRERSVTGNADVLILAAAHSDAPPVSHRQLVASGATHHNVHVHLVQANEGTCVVRSDTGVLSVGASGALEVRACNASHAVIHSIAQSARDARAPVITLQSQPCELEELILKEAFYLLDSAVP